jgi:two-component system OmpR family response regulator
VAERTFRALVVDDDASASFLVTEALRLASFQTHTVATGRDALARLDRDETDVVILETTLCDIDGFDICDRIRGSGSQVPLVFLSKRASVADRVRGFDLGADDYIGKPFHVEEVVARVRAVLRRANGCPGREASDVLRIDDLVLDQRSHEVTRAGRAIALSPNEYKVLHILLLNQSHVLSRAQLLERVWGYDYLGGSTVVESCISGLRRKLGRDRPQLIHTVREFGYRICATCAT